MKRIRLDEEMVAQGLCDDRDGALRLLMAGVVSSAGERLASPAAMVAPGAAIHVRRRGPYVGRGGIKLAGGMDALGVDPRARACADIGCSTGGFTDCLLKRGASIVIAIDVGRGQFDWSLRHDPRVTLLEGTNVVDVGGLGYRRCCDLVVCDVSFTSIRRIIDAALDLLTCDGSLLALVKPQFEAAPREVGAGGVVRDPDVRRRVLERTAALFADRGLPPVAVCASPITGAKGNREFFLLGNRAMLATFGPKGLERHMGALRETIGAL